MKATFDKNKKQKFTTGHRKEGARFESYSVFDLADKQDPLRMDSAIELRIYYTARCYACLWISRKGISGSGMAGGYGYHKPSAAMQVAVENAGFTLSQAIDGCGESSMKEALMAIAQEIGLKKPAIFHAHA